MANAAAVEAKLLLSEYSKCGCSGRYGDHQPSAISWPCRMIIKLCISISGADSRVSRKVKMPSGWTPWDSAELCGSALTVMPASLEREHYHSWEPTAWGFGCNQRAVPGKDAGSSKSELEVSRSDGPRPRTLDFDHRHLVCLSCQGVQISDITGKDRPASARQHRQPQLGFQMAGMPPAARIHRCCFRARRTDGQSSPLRNQPLAACRWSRRGVAVPNRVSFRDSMSP